MRADLIRCNEPTVPRAMAGKTPQIGAIIDVENHLRAGFLREPNGLFLRGIAVFLGEMRSGDQHRARPAINSRVTSPSSSAASAQSVRRRSAGRNSRRARPKHERGEPLGIGREAINAHALTHQLLANESAHRLVAHTGDERGFQPQARRPTAMLVGQPPTAFTKLAMSSRRPPICWP